MDISLTKVLLQLRQRAKSFPGVLAVFIYLATTPASDALDASHVYELVAPGTVQIYSLDSAGSGVFLTDSGLVLTNFHVVASNIELKVKAKFKTGGKLIEAEVPAAIVKVHPSYDLRCSR